MNIRSPERAEILEEELLSNQATLGSIKQCLRDINHKADQLDPMVMMEKMNQLVQLTNATNKQLATRTLMTEEMMEYADIMDLEETLQSQV